ncbi:hypothetical protein JR316_0005303 [Psilocybe cubensis]|uniref:Uncharacterized protein n=2 Tax=Psilocybe cubensis TaxID=181762 RepID=A0ACB8H7P3_PSICU|nr:hypothetical protein JR316_0005303 [Psilocybe cubensis]KAH9483199.1 hypothetical protein JR316_0005303 [Psilocybe cubensis]
MQSFAFHFKKTLHFLRVDGVEYGDQCGGLALSVAALERGLDLIISNDVSPTGMKAVTNTDSKKKRSLAFAEANWGKKVRKWVETALLLKPEHWSRIQNGAVDILAASMGELGSSEAEEDIATDPRLMIGLDD